MSTGGQQPAGNVTSTQAPAPYMYPYMGTALQQAAGLLNGPGPQYYPGQTVAGFSPEQNQAFGNITSLAGSNPLGAATKYNNALLNGNYGSLGMGNEADLAGGNFNGAGSEYGALSAMGQGGATNPFLDQMYSQAAGATQNQLASEFAGAGRNVNASQALRGQQLNDLATSMYGGAYQQDQANALAANEALSGAQMGAQNTLLGARENAVGNAQNLMGSNLGLQNALAGVGGQVQNQAQQQIGANQNMWNYYQQLPYNQLQQYEGEIGALQPGMSSSNPYFNNPLGNALGTGMAGLGIYNAGSTAGLWGSGKGAASGAGAAAASDRRLKTDVTRIGSTDEGLPLYSFRYHGDPVFRIGPMADEVREKQPEAVFRAPDGYDRVYYGMLR